MHRHPLRMRTGCRSHYLLRFSHVHRHGRQTSKDLCRRATVIRPSLNPAKEGEAPPRAHLPRPPLDASAVRVPRNKSWKGAAADGLWQRRFPPGSLPQVWGIATRRQLAKRPARGFVPSGGHKLSVRNRTCAAISCVD